MAVGFGWMVAARWAIRGIGLVGTIILARLLAPSDFGLLAMGAVTAAFVRVFAEAGQQLAIIRHPNPTAEHFDTAWTMSVCGGLLVALVLLAIAPLAGLYFHDPRAVTLIRFLALAPFIEGFINIGAAAGFRRDLSFARDFRFLVARKLSEFIVAVPAALVLRNYWALAIGIVFGRLVSVLVSYRMHPYRPRLRLTTLHELWSFSAWTQLGAIAQYFGEQTDQIAVGGLAGTEWMGQYNIAQDLATSPINEFVIPAARSLFPVYATLLDDPARLVQSYLEVLSFVAVVALSTGVGVALVAKDMVLLVLGSKWADATLLIPWLAIAGAALGIGRSVNAVLGVTGNVRLSAMRNWAFVAFLAPPTILCGLRWGSEGVAAARMVVTILFAPAMFYTLMQVLPITAGQIFARLWRPALAAIAMSAVVILSGTNGIPLLVLRLLCNVALGTATFTAVLLGAWYLSGRPAGAEQILIAQARKLPARLAAAFAQRVAQNRSATGKFS